MSDKKREFISRIFQENYRDLCKYLASKLRCRHKAADVAQEVYLRIFSLENPEEIRHPRAFIYKMASNLAVDSIRRQKARLNPGCGTSAIEQIPSPDSSPESIVDARQRLKILRKAIEELPPKRRTVFLLHKFKGFSHAEIAARFGISKNMVEKHIIKAMAYCRKRMEKLE